MLAREDTQLLLEVNRPRPWMILQLRLRQQTLPQPDGAELERALDHVRSTMCGDDFRDVVERHLVRYDYPFEASWLADIR
jgi:hypothetical protein